MTEDGKNFAVDTPEGKETLDFIFKLLHVYKVSPFIVDFLEAFMRSETAMCLCGYGDLEYLRKNAAFSWDIVEIPRGRTTATLMITDGFVCSKNIANLKTAQEFLSFLLSPPAQEIIFRQQSVIPMNIKVAENNQIQIPAHYNIYKQIIRTACHSNLPFSGELLRILSRELNLFWGNIQNFEELCYNLEKSRKEPLQAAM